MYHATMPKPKPREPPQQIANEATFLDLTQKDIPRIIQGFVQLLSDISLRRVNTQGSYSYDYTFALLAPRPQTPKAPRPNAGE